MKLLEIKHERNSSPVIPRKQNSKTGNGDIDWCLYKYRHLVENAFARLRQAQSTLFSTCASPRDLRCALLNKTQTGNLVVYGRGYPAVWFYIYHILKNVDFCMRIVKSSNIVKAFLESGKYSDIVDFPYTDKSLRRFRKDKISTETLRLRSVRVDLPSGEPEVLFHH